MNKIVSFPININLNVNIENVFVPPQKISSELSPQSSFPSHISP